MQAAALVAGGAPTAHTGGVAGATIAGSDAPEVRLTDREAVAEDAARETACAPAAAVGRRLALPLRADAHAICSATARLVRVAVAVRGAEPHAGILEIVSPTPGPALAVEIWRPLGHATGGRDGAQQASVSARDHAAGRAVHDDLSGRFAGKRGACARGAARDAARPNPCEATRRATCPRACAAPRPCGATRRISSDASARRRRAAAPSRPAARASERADRSRRAAGAFDARARGACQARLARRTTRVAVLSGPGAEAVHAGLAVPTRGRAQKDGQQGPSEQTSGRAVRAVPHDFSLGRPNEPHRVPRTSDATRGVSSIEMGRPQPPDPLSMQRNGEPRPGLAQRCGGDEPVPFWGQSSASMHASAGPTQKSPGEPCPQEPANRESRQVSPSAQSDEPLHSAGTQLPAPPTFGHAQAVPFGQSASVAQR